MNHSLAQSLNEFRGLLIFGVYFAFRIFLVWKRNSARKQKQERTGSPKQVPQRYDAAPPGERQAPVFGSLPDSQSTHTTPPLQAPGATASPWETSTDDAKNKKR
jgi:hypothetical protein